MTQNKSKHQHHWFRWSLRIIFGAAVVAGLIMFLCSSFAVKKIWLPWLAHSLDCSATAEHAAFHLFGNGPNLFIRGLNIKDSRGNTLYLANGEAQVRPLYLLLGIADLDLIRIVGADIQISGKMPEIKGPSPLVTRDLRIGSVEIIDSNVNRKTGAGPHGQIYISSLSLSGLIPYSENQILGKITVYPEEDESKEQPQFSLWTEIRFSVDRDFCFNKIFGSITLDNGTGIWKKRSLSGLGGSVFFSSGEHSNGKKLNLKISSEISGADCVDLISSRGNILWDQAADKGSLTLKSRARFSDVRAHDLYFPDTIGVHIFPENLHMNSMLLTLNWDRKTISWTVNGEVNADKLWVQDTRSIPNGSFRFQHSASYVIPRGELCVKEWNNRLTAGSSSVECKNEGDFVFSQDEKGYHIKANNSMLVLHVRSLPAELLNFLFPFDFADGNFSLDYKIAANSDKQKLTGNMSFLIRNAAFDNAEGKRIIRPQDIFADFVFHSRGLDNITGLIVDKCSMDIFAERNNRILRAEMSGFWEPGNEGLSLSGNMVLNPYEAAERICDPLAESFLTLLKCYHAEKGKYHCSIQTDWDPKKTKQLSFDIQTSFDALAFLESETQEPLTLNISGNMMRDSNALESQIIFDSIKLHANDLVKADAAGKLSLSNGQADFRLTVDSLSPEIIRGLMRLCAQQKYTEKQIALFHWDSFSGKTAFSFDPVNRMLRIMPLQINMVPGPEKSLASLSLDHDFLCFLDDPKKTEAAMTLILENFPLKWFAFLLPQNAAYRFQSGVANGTAEVTVRNNAADIYLDHDLMVENYSFSINDALWHIGDCRIGGKSCFRDFFTSYDLIGTNIRCLDGTRSYLEVNVDGSLAFTPSGLTFYDFSILNTGNSFPEKLFGKSASCFQVKGCDLAGKLRYDGNEDFSENKVVMNLNVKALDLETGTDFRHSGPLHGFVRFDLFSHPDALRIKDAGIRLGNRKKQPILDLQMEGTLAHTDANKDTLAKCFIKSRGINGEFLFRALTAGKPARSQVTSGNTMQKTRKGVWPFLHEPPDLSLKGFKSNLVTDLQNVTLTDHIRMSLSGSFRVENEILQAPDILLKINDAQAHCSVKLTAGKKDGCEYEGKLSVSHLNFSKLVLALAKLKETETVMKDLRGTIRDLDFSLKGKGVSLTNLDKHLNMNLNLSAENVSVPFDAGTAVVLLRILLLPVQQIPRLVKFFPQSLIRDLLQRVVGESMDIYSGYRNVEFTQGSLELESQGTDIHIKKMYFTGPQIRTRVCRGCFNPFYNEIDIESLTLFSGVNLPFHFTGSLDSPQIEPSYFIGEFLKQSTVSAGEKTVYILSLGLVNSENEATIWAQPAKIKPVSDEAKQRRKTVYP